MQKRTVEDVPKWLQMKQFGLKNTTNDDARWPASVTRCKISLAVRSTVVLADGSNSWESEEADIRRQFIRKLEYNLSAKPVTAHL